MASWFPAHVGSLCVDDHILGRLLARQTSLTENQYPQPQAASQPIPAPEITQGMLSRLWQILGMQFKFFKSKACELQGPHGPDAGLNEHSKLAPGCWHLSDGKLRGLKRQHHDTTFHPGTSRLPGLGVLQGPVKSRAITWAEIVG